MPASQPEDEEKSGTATAESDEAESGAVGESESVVGRKQPHAAMGWCPQCHTTREACFGPDDWACASCGQHNYPSSTLCSNERCGLPREDLELGVEESSPLPPKRRAKSPWCLSCKVFKSDCYLMNDWECPWCGNHNWARKQVVVGNVWGWVVGWFAGRCSRGRGI